jgi:hypothetical protein
MSIDFRTVARTPLQHAPQASERPLRRSSSEKPHNVRPLVGSNYSFNTLVPFELPLPTEDRRSHGDPARRRQRRPRPQSAQPFRSVEEQHSSSTRLTSGASSASLGESRSRPSTAPARRRPSSGSSVRGRPSSGGVRSATQRPWLDERLRADEGGQQIFAKLRHLENVTARNVPSERLAACSELFDAVIQVDTTYGAVLQRVKQEYDDVVGGVSHGDTGWADRTDGTLVENYAHLSKEYKSQTEEMDAQSLDFKILSEQYDIILKQKERLAQEHEADQRRISEQQQAIASLEHAAEIEISAAAQRRSMDLASVQVSSTDHVRKLEKLVQELAEELDAARSTEATALRELVALRALLGEPDLDEASADWPTTELDMVEREQSAAALQTAATAERYIPAADTSQASPLVGSATAASALGAGTGASSELSVEDAASIASTLGSASELASLASSRAPVPRPATVPALDVSAASLASEVEGMTADGAALAAQREAEAQSEALGQVEASATLLTEPASAATPPAIGDSDSSAEAELTTAIEAVVSPKACDPLDESSEHGTPRDLSST